MEQAMEINAQIAEQLMPTKTEPLDKLKTDYDVNLEFLFFSPPQTKPEILRKTLHNTIAAKVAVLKEEERLDPQSHQFNLEFQKNLQQWEGARDVVLGLRTREASTLLNVMDEMKRDAVGAAIELCDRDVAAAGSWAKAAALDMLEHIGYPAARMVIPELSVNIESRSARRQEEIAQAENLKWKRIERAREVDTYIRETCPQWLRGGEWKPKN